MAKRLLTIEEKDQISNIIDRFDFEKVHAYMTIKDWKKGGKVPEVKELKHEATILLTSLAKEPMEFYRYIPNLGLLALKTSTGLSLFFYIENKNSIDI